MMLTASRIQPDCCAKWQAANGAAWCGRLSATITATTCRVNQQQSIFDYRCDGCGGLYDQPDPRQECTVLAFERCDDKTSEELMRADASIKDAGLSEKDRRESCCQLADDELDDFLADMFPDEDTDNDEGEECREHIYLEDPPENTGRRVAVYMGRCTRCGGYMINDLEQQSDLRDKDVYHCVTCGWRTSPQYENNRAFFASGMGV